MVSFLNTKNNLFFMLVVFVLILNNSSKCNTNTTTILLLVWWSFFLNINLEKSKLVFLFMQSTTNLNVNLLNGVMLIHPIILYLFYGIYLLENKVILRNYFLKSIKYVHVKNIRNYTSGTFLIFIAILLGGW